MGNRSLLQGIFPTKGSNPGLLHCRQILYCFSHQGSHFLITFDEKDSTVSTTSHCCNAGAIFSPFYCRFFITSLAIIFFCPLFVSHSWNISSVLCPSAWKQPLALYELSKYFWTLMKMNVVPCPHRIYIVVGANDKYKISRHNSI